MSLKSWTANVFQPRRRPSRKAARRNPLRMEGMEDRVVPASIITPAGLNPGDHFTVAFVTSGHFNATSQDIATYNNEITAAAAGHLTYNGINQNWVILGATPTVNNYDTLFASAAPVYSPTGTFLGANGSAFLNSTTAAINIDENLQTEAPAFVWIGGWGPGGAVNALGLGDRGAQHLVGVGSIGSPMALGGISANADNFGHLHSLYGFADLVVNGPPAIAVDSPAGITVSEGSTAAKTGTWSDANAGDTVTLSASIGVVVKSGTNAAGTWSWSYTPTSAAPTQTVTITASDGIASTQTSFSLTVVNTLATHALIEGPAGYDASVAVTTPGAWTATAHDAWLHTSSSGTGNGTALFTVDANTGATRVGTLTIAGETLTVTQAGSTYAAAYPQTSFQAGVPGGNSYVFDTAGNLYFPSGSTIQKLDAATQTISTMISSGLTRPIAIAVDNAGNLFIQDLDVNYNSTVKKWDAASQTLTVAIPATAQGMYGMYGLAVDPADNIYVANGNKDYEGGGIYEFNAANPNGLLVTNYHSSNQGVAFSVGTDAAGNVYWIEAVFQGFAHKLNVQTQEITDLGGMGAGYYYPAMAVDGAGNVYSNDGSGFRVHDAATQTTTVAIANGDSQVTTGMAVDAAGNVYFNSQYPFTNATASVAAGLVEVPHTFVPAGAVTETAAAGSDSLLPVMSTQTLLGQFAPTSDQSWLTIGSVAGDVVHFSFTQNTTGASRTANISILGKTIAVTQSPPNTPPTVAADSGAVSANEGSSVTNSGTFSDPEGNSTVTISASVGLITQDNTNGTWGWSLPVADGPAGPITVTITADDHVAAPVTTTFTYSVFNVDPTAPTDTNAAANTVQEGSANGTLAGITASSTDVGNPDPITYSLTNNAGGRFAIHPTTGVVSVANAATLIAGTYSITALASDGDGGAASSSFSITVTDAPLTAGALTAPTGTGMATVSTYIDNTHGLKLPDGVIFDAAGNLFVSSSGNNRVYKVTPAGVISTFVSTIVQPAGMAFDGGGNLVVASYGGGQVYKVTPAGSVSLFASGFNGPSTVAYDANGNLYVPNLDGRVHKVTPAGSVSLFASGFNTPTGLAFDTAGNLYVGNQPIGTISKVTPAGVVSPFASGLSYVHGLAYNAGTLFAIDEGNNRVVEVSSAGVVSPFATGFDTPLGQIAFDAAGNLYVPNYFINTVSKATLPAPVEGQAITNKTVFHFTDANPYGIASDFTATVNTGDATLTSTANPSNVQIVASAGGGFDVRLSHTYADSLTSATFSVSVMDDGGSSTSASINTFSVGNVAPTASLSSSDITYGQTASFAFADQHDASSVDTAAGFHYAYSATGDFTGVTYANTVGSSASHDYGGLNAGAYTFYARIIDKDGGFTQYRGDVNVNKAEAAVVYTGYTGGIYTGGSHTQTVTVTGVGGAADVLFTGSLSATNADIHSKFWSFSNDNYNPVDESGTLAFTIAKADAKVAVVNSSGAYDGGAHTASVTITGVGGDGTLAGKSITGTNVADSGSTTASISGLTNYNDASGTATLVINKANGAVVVTPYTGTTYDSNSHSATVASITGVNGETGATVGVVTRNTTHTNAGSYSDSWSFTGTANYNDIASTAITDSIAKADAKVAVVNSSGAYDGGAHTASVTITGVGGDGTLAGKLITGTNVADSGSTTASISGLTNYNDVSGTATLAIDKASSTTTTVGAGPYIYTGSAQIGGSGTVTGAGGLSTAATSVTYSAASTGTGTADQTDAGTYYVTAHYAGDANHTASDGAAVAITINKAASTTTTVSPVVPATRVYQLTPYGNSAFSVSGTITTDGVVDLGIHSAAEVVSWTVDVTNLSTQAITHYSGTGATFVTTPGLFFDATTLRQATGRGPGYVEFDSPAGVSILREEVVVVTSAARDLVVTTAFGTWDDNGHHLSNYFPQVASGGVAVPLTYDGTTHSGGSGTVTGIGGLSTSATSLTYTGDQVDAGIYYVTAHYAGDPNHLGSDGAAVGIIINKANATVGVTPYTGTTYDGNAHTATVTSITGVHGETGGTVGVVTLNATHTNAGVYTDSWSFTGAANYNNIASTNFTDVINKTTSSTTLTSNVGTSVFGQVVTFTATVTSPAGPLTGSVNFFDGGSQIGSGTVVNGQVTFSTSTLAIGSGHSITAAYVGDGNHLASTSAARNQVVTAVTAAGLQSAISALPAGGTLTVQTANATQLTSLLSAVQGLAAQSTPANVVVDLGSNTYTTNISVNPPAGINVTLQGNGISSVVNGNVTVNQGGNGASATTVAGLTVNGQLNLGTGNGAGGSLMVANTSVSGGTTLQTGNGAGTSITVQGSTLAGNVQIQTGNGANNVVKLIGAVFTGSPSLQMGNGNGNTLTINGSTFQQNAQVQLGNGTGGAVAVDNTTFAGKFDLQTGNGGDTVSIGAAAGSHVYFGGLMTAVFGNGADTLWLGTGAGAGVTFGTSGTFNGKNGIDIAHVNVGQVTGSYTLISF